VRGDALGAARGDALVACGDGLGVARRHWRCVPWRTSCRRRRPQRLQRLRQRRGTHASQLDAHARVAPSLRPCDAVDLGTGGVAGAAAALAFSLAAQAFEAAPAAPTLTAAAAQTAADAAMERARGYAATARGYSGDADRRGPRAARHAAAAPP